MLEVFKKIPVLWRVIIIAVLVLILIWGLVTLKDKIGRQWDVYKDNKADAVLKQKVDALEAEKIENKRQIDVLKADNIKLSAERDAIDARIVIIQQALANDGKIVASEQKKIDEANKKYNETKDSCSSAISTDEYVECVCTKLGVACS